MTEDQQLPITALVIQRSNELGLSRPELVRRSGYTNISKGLRRLDELCDGDFRSARGLIQALPTSLEVSSDVVAKAVEDTQRHFRETEEAAYRSSFVPHAIILTDRKIPQPIFVAAIMGVDQLLRVDFDLMKEPATFVEQALHGLQEKISKGNCGSIPAFGKPTGVVVNYRPDHAIEFDLRGNPLRVLERAHRPGTATFSLKGHALPLTQREMAAVFGARVRLSSHAGRRWPVVVP
jgi:hypothetical protein